MHKARLACFAAIAALLMSAVVSAQQRELAGKAAVTHAVDPDRLLKTMPGWNPPGSPRAYRAGDYCLMARYLQGLGKDKAVAKLKAVARANPDASQVFVLCRMLFVARGRAAFRAPMLGAPGFVGDTARGAWPLEPIALVDGVPFLVVTGYNLGGQAEPPSMYLDYCLQNCDWNPHRYASKTPDQLRRALRKLLASAKWKRPLEPHEVAFLSDQIK